MKSLCLYTINKDFTYLRYLCMYPHCIYSVNQIKTSFRVAVFYLVLIEHLHLKNTR